MALKLLGSLESSGGDLQVLGTIKTSTHGDGLVFGSPTTVKFKLGVYGGNDLLFKDPNNNVLMALTSTGLGIGTSSPTKALEVIGDIKIKQASTYSNYSLIDASEALLTLSTYTVNASAYPADIKFSPNQTERMRITDDGNVGIGTSAPLEKLHVVGKINSSNNIVSNSTYTMFTGRSSRTVDDYGGLNKQYFKANLVTPGPNTTGESSAHGIADLRFQLANSAGNTGMSDIMTLRSGGNVGIGTATPNEKLTVAGNVHAYAPSGINAGLFASTAAGATSIAIRSSGVTSFNAGNVGIGTTNPQAALHVGGAFNTNAPTGNGVLMGLYNSSHGYIQLNGPSGAYIDFSASGTDHKGRLLYDNTGNYMRFDTNGSERMRIDSSGNVTFAGDVSLADSKKLKFGAGNDLQIYHDGSYSFISNTGTGSLIVRATNFAVQSADGTDDFITTVQNAQVNLFYNNAKKFETTSTGVTVTGDADVSSTVLVGNNNSIFAENNLRFKSAGAAFIDHNTVSQSIKFRLSNSSSLDVIPLEITPLYLSSTVDMYFADNDKIRMGAGSDLQIYHDGSNSFIRDLGTGNLLIDSNGAELKLRVNTTENALIANSDGSVELYYNNIKKFETATTGVTVTGKISGLTAGTANTDAVNVQQLNNATTGTLIYKGTWSAAPTTTSVLDGAISGAGTIVIEAVNPGISVGATVTGTGISGTVTVSSIAADGITIAISSSQTIADGTTLTFTTVGGTPDLSQASRKVTGHYYICETAGAATPNGASTTPNEWAVGDWATFSDLTTDAWQKIDNSSVLSGAGTGGKVPVWSGTGTSVTLADAPITVSGNNAAFAGSITATSANLTTSGTVLSLDRTGGATALIELKIGGTIEGYLGATTTKSLVVFNESAAEKFSVSNAGNAIFAGDVATGNMTISGQEIDVSSGDLTLDVAGDIVLSADGGDIQLLDGATAMGRLGFENGDLNIASTQQDYDIRLKGNDGGSVITALHLDMSEGGNATFAGNVNLGTAKILNFSGTSFQILHDGSNGLINNSTGDIKIQNSATDKDIIFKVKDGASNAEAMRIDGSANRLGIGVTAPKSKLQVAGGIQMAGDTAAASADKVGTMRYRTDTEYVEVNGTELVTNGDFAADSDWTKETGWSIASGKASYDASSATNALYQSIGLTTGSVYRLSFTVVNYTSGSFKGHLSNGNVTAATDAISANGDYSFNITATGALVLFRNVTSFNGSIDNVSVIEVTAEDASYADMCMQTGASTYEWVNIVRNTY